MRPRLVTSLASVESASITGMKQSSSSKVIVSAAERLGYLPPPNALSIFLLSGEATNESIPAHIIAVAIGDVMSHASRAKNAKKIIKGTLPLKKFAYPLAEATKFTPLDAIIKTYGLLYINRQRRCVAPCRQKNLHTMDSSRKAPYIRGGTKKIKRI